MVAPLPLHPLHQFLFQTPHPLRLYNPPLISPHQIIPLRGNLIPSPPYLLSPLPHLFLPPLPSPLPLPLALHPSQFPLPDLPPEFPRPHKFTPPPLSPRKQRTRPQLHPYGNSQSKNRPTLPSLLSLLLGGRQIVVPHNTRGPTMVPPDPLPHITPRPRAATPPATIPGLHRGTQPPHKFPAPRGPSSTLSSPRPQLYRTLGDSRNPPATESRLHRHRPIRTGLPVATKSARVCRTTTTLNRFEQATRWSATTSHGTGNVPRPPTLPAHVPSRPSPLNSREHPTRLPARVVRSRSARGASSPPPLQIPVQGR